jgi:hypothetical protein
METITTTESRTDALRRLLVIARESGVRLGVDQHGDFWATSTSEPARLYPVGPESCGCRGFQAHRRCRHVAALWAHLGYLDDPEPDPGMTITCAHTDGHYTLEADPEWREPRTEILVDGDVKVRITGETYGLSVHWLEAGRPIDDLTGCTPSYMDHYEAVRYWIESLDTRVPSHVAMQKAGLFPAGEFVDAEPIAA